MKHRKTQCLSIKKRLVSHETGLVYMNGEVFKGGSRNSATFKIELFATISRGRNFQRASSDGLTTNRQYLHVAAVTQPSLQVKLKTNENGHALNVAPDTLSCFVHMFFTFFRKRQLLSVSLTFCFNSKINFKKLKLVS